MPVLKIKNNGKWETILGGAGGDSVEVDTSLTQEGMAADAKAVGDMINSLTKIIAVDDGEGNIELKPFLTHEGLLSEILEGEY